MSPKRRDVLSLAAILVLAGGLATGATFAARAAGNDGRSPAPVTVTAVRTETVTTTMPASPSAQMTKTVTVTATQTTSQGAPATQFANGSFKVGFDVLDGSYHTNGPAQGVNTGCVWKRLRPAGGVIAQGSAFGPITIFVHDGELMTATGCQQWSQN